MKPLKGGHISEKKFQDTVIELARLCGFTHIYHTWNSQNSPAGFPDIVALKGKRQVVAELKSEKGKLSKEQKDWLLAFAAVPGNEVYCWRPSDFSEIESVLRGEQ